jgi:hypothetical protein
MKPRRKPGPGRKPAGPLRGKSSNFSTRITQETRQALETEAQGADQSVSQVAEQFLRLGIATKRERERPNAIRALGYIVAELAEVICRGKKDDWRTNPFLFETLGLAIQKFLDVIRPAGEIQPLASEQAERSKLNSIVGGPLDSPQARADWAVAALLNVMRQSKAEPFKAEMFPGIPLPADVLTEMERTSYGMVRARADLQIDFGGDRS